MKRDLRLRVCDKTVQLLEQKANELGCTKSEVMRYLILHYGKNLK